MALTWSLRREGRDAITITSAEKFTDIVQIYEELLLHVFHANGSNIFVENLCFAERDGAVPNTSIVVRRGDLRALRLSDSLSIRAIRNTTRKRELCMRYGLTSSVASQLHRMRRKYIKTYCLLSQPSYHRLLPLCSSDIRAIFTLDEDAKVWPPLDLTRVTRLPTIALSSENGDTTDTEMPSLILDTADDALPVMEAVAPAEVSMPAPWNDGEASDNTPPNALEEVEVFSNEVPPTDIFNHHDPLPELPSEREMEEFFNIADLLSFAIGYFTIANRRHVLNQDLESSQIAAGILRGLDHLLEAPIRSQLAIEEFKIAYQRLADSVEEGSELSERLQLSNIQLQLSLLSTDVEEAVEAVGSNPDA